MTYKELIGALSSLSKEQLEYDIIIHQDNDEYMPAVLTVAGFNNGILDDGYPMITFVDNDGNILETEVEAEEVWVG